MQAVFEKIIEKLEERTSFLSDCTKYGNKDAEQQKNSYSTMMMYEVADLVDDLIEIVKQEAEQYNVMIDGEYCFQSCGCTEMCGKCSRIANGDTDYYESICAFSEQYNNGWIPCSERLPEANQMVLSTEKDSEYVILCCYEFFEGYGYGFNGSKGNIIAWQPLPQPFHEKGEIDE